jgi:hypothetical protein
MNDSHAVAGRVSAETFRRLEEKLQNSTYSTMGELVGAILEVYAKLEEIDPVTLLRTRKVEGVNGSNRPPEDFLHNPMCSLCVYRKRG